MDIVCKVNNMRLSTMDEIEALAANLLMDSMGDGGFGFGGGGNDQGNSGDGNDDGDDNMYD